MISHKEHEKDKKNKITSLSIEELAKAQILNSEYGIYKDLEQKIKSLELKINDLNARQSKLESKINQFNDKTKKIEEKLIDLNNISNETQVISDYEKEQEFNAEFLKASDLIPINKNNNPENSVIQSKIKVCNQLLNYLEKKFVSKSITEKEYEINKHKIRLKIKQLQNKINKIDDSYK